MCRKTPEALKGRRQFAPNYYDGLLANRNRERALELCLKVLPGPPVRKAQKMDWRDRLQSLTGIDPMRCEVCGQKALRLVETMAPARSPRAPPL